MKVWNTTEILPAKSDPGDFFPFSKIQTYKDLRPVKVHHDPVTLRHDHNIDLVIDFWVLSTIVLLPPYFAQDEDEDHPHHVGSTETSAAGCSPLRRGDL